MRQKVLFFVSPKISAKKIGVIKKMFAKHLDSSVYETIFSHEMDRSGDGKLVANNYEAVVTVGGDGTLLKACHEFHNQITPPIISFNAGNMGFLVPFSSSSMQHKAIEYIVSNDSTRKRLGFLTKKYSRGL
ncbi:MAG: NADH kinase pos5, partial [Marteilia pararefringens]